MRYAMSFRLTVLLAALLICGSGCSVFGQAPEDEGEPLPHDFDVDNNDGTDFAFVRESIGTEGGNPDRSFMAYSRGNNSLLSIPSGLAPLEKGMRIGPPPCDSLEWVRGVAVYFYRNDRRVGPWIGAGKKYFGFRVGEDQNARYGWALISVDAAEGRSTPERLVEAVLYDYALGAPGEAIRAGEKP